MLDQITDNCPTRLAARSCDYELHESEAYGDGSAVRLSSSAAR
jgi:hypothetical protein